jgi:ABC-type transporter Mla subunit MlaD
MKKDMKIGTWIIVVIITILLLTFGWKFISKEPSYFLNIKFNDIGTLQLGDAVIIQGVKSGVVKKIALQNSDILISIKLPKSLLIPKNSEFYMSNIGIMGEKAIQISRSKENEYYKANDTIQGAVPPQPISIGESIGKLASSITAEATIPQKLDSIIVLLNKQMVLIEKNRVEK